MAANDSRALTRPPRLHGVIDPVVIFGCPPRGEKSPSKAGSFFDNTPYISAPPKKPTPLFPRTSPWIAGHKK